MVSTPSVPKLDSNSGGRTFLAFVNDNESANTLQQFASAHGLDKAVVKQGDIETAIEYLKNNASPEVLCVDVASAEAAPAALDRLADVCAPGIKVIISGKINEYSFYCWLVDMGVANYLLKPFTLEAVEVIYSKLTMPMTTAIIQSSEPPRNAKVIAVIGARGGVGATTFSVNLAWILANRFHQKTALLDFDPQLGTVSLALDLEPGRGLKDALEKPERIDGLFIDRVMVRVNDFLSVLSTEEALEENINATDAAAEALFAQTKPKFTYIIVDVPRILSSFSRYAITHADQVVCVTEYNIMGLRESLRYLDYFREILKAKPPLFIANRVGLAEKHQMPQGEFEKGLGQKVAFNIPYAIDVHSTSVTGEVIAQTAKNSAIVKVLESIAAHFAPGIIEQKTKTGLHKLLAWGKGEK